MKRFISIVLALCLVITAFACLGGRAAAVSFTDVASNHWAAAYISYLSGKEVLVGDGNGKFRPDSTVSRAEFIKMIDATFGLTGTAAVSFTKMPDWAAPYIKAAAAQGYLLSYAAGTDFDAKLTREEAVALLVRYLDVTATAEAKGDSIKDFDSIDKSYRDYVLAAVENGIIAGYTDGTFKPTRTLTRAEALTVLYKAAGAIYSASSSVAETGCNEENATINKNANLTGLKLKGNVYVTEGASLVALNNCEIDGTLYVRGGAYVTLTKSTAQRVVMMGSDSTLSLSSASAVTRVEATRKTSLIINNGCGVTTFIAYTGAANSAVTGSGTLKNIGVYVNGVTSIPAPEEYYISKGCTAVLAGVTYKEGTGKTVSSGFTAATCRGADSSTGHTISLHYTVDTAGTIYAAAWLTSAEPYNAASIKANYMATASVTAGASGELLLTVPYNCFNYNTALVLYTTDGALIPLYNGEIIAATYRALQSSPPAAKAVAAPAWSMALADGVIKLTFNQAMYTKSADTMPNAPLGSVPFLSLATYKNDSAVTLNADEYLVEALIEDGKSVVYLYPDAGITADTEYIVTLDAAVVNLYGTVPALSTRTLVAGSDDAAVITPSILPATEYVLSGSSIRILLPAGAARLRYTYTINGTSASLPVTVTGDTSISLTSLSDNTLITMTVTALSNSGNPIGSSITASYVVNVTPVVTVGGTEYTGQGTATLDGTAVVSAAIPKVLTKPGYSVKLYIDSELQTALTSTVKSSSSSVTAILYDGETIVGKTLISIAS